MVNDIDSELTKRIEIWVELDLLYIDLERLQQAEEKRLPTSGLDSMIDDATGYGADKCKEFNEKVMKIFKRIYELKKSIGMDVTDLDALFNEVDKINSK